MAVLTGNSGEILFDGTAIGKCRNFSLDISKDALETTVLGDYDRTYVQGLRGATGSATILYDSQDTSGVALLNNILSNGDSNNKVVQMKLNKATGGAAISCNAIITQVSSPVSVGEVTACSINFQVTGEMTGNFTGSV